MLSLVKSPRLVAPPMRSALRIHRELCERDAVLFKQGEPNGKVYQVVRGAVLTYRILLDGRRQLEALHFAGDALGLEGGLEHRVSAQALSTTIVRSVSRSELELLAMARPRIARRFLDATMDGLRRSQHHAMNLTRRSARERMASLLLELDERTAGAALLDLPMTRQDIADYLSLTVETVSRVLTHFQQRGLINLPTARQILLRDPAPLRAMLE